MPRKRTTRLYLRRNSPNYYCDLRDLGGGQVSLGTDGFELAEKRAGELVQELRNRHRDRELLGVQPHGLEAFALHYLETRASDPDDDVTESWLRSLQRGLEEAVEYFGAETAVHMIPAASKTQPERPSVKGWLRWLEREKGYAGGTRHHRLVALSSLFELAVLEGVAAVNPASQLRRGSRPKANDNEPDFFEVHEAAMILEAARHYKPRWLPPDVLHPLVAFFLYTGARLSEGLGMEWSDLNFDRGIVRIGPTHSRTRFMTKQGRRGLKTQKSIRTLPLVPDLHHILTDYQVRRPPGRMLFFVTADGTEEAIGPKALNRELDRIAKIIRWATDATEAWRPLLPMRLRCQGFRNTYAAARLQCLDHGHPIAKFTVQRELGHSNMDMLDRLYGHLGRFGTAPSTSSTASSSIPTGPAGWMA
jgi:integrase